MRFLKIINKCVVRSKDEAGRGEPINPPSANYDNITAQEQICDSIPPEEADTESMLTEDERSLLRTHRRTVVITEAIECKIILIGRLTLNSQYEEVSEVRVP